MGVVDEPPVANISEKSFAQEMDDLRGRGAWNLLELPLEELGNSEPDPN